MKLTRETKRYSLSILFLFENLREFREYTKNLILLEN